MISFFSTVLAQGLSPDIAPLVCGGSGVKTALGCFNFTNPTSIAIQVVTTGVGIAGGISLFLMVTSAFKIMTSQGDPKRLQDGQETLVSALAGLFLVVTSAFFLRFLGVEILGLF